MSIESVVPCNYLILCRPLLPPSIFPSIGVFSNESVLHVKWPKDWSYSFSLSPSNEYSGLISFRTDRLDLLAVRGTPQRLLQHRSSKASIPQRAAFFTVQLSHPYVTSGKTIALTRRTRARPEAVLTCSRFSLPHLQPHPRLEVSRPSLWVCFCFRFGFQDASGPMEFGFYQFAFNSVFPCRLLAD